MMLSTDGCIIERLSISNPKIFFDMKERPILFSGPMVRAILDGRKTQTRRILQPQPGYPGTAKLVFGWHPFAPSAFVGTPAEGLQVAPEKMTWLIEDWAGNIVGTYGDCPYGEPGDLLLVDMPNGETIVLKVVGVRVERLQEISETDAIAEGILSLSKDDRLKHGVPSVNVSEQYPIKAFSFFWDSIYGKSSGCKWKDDPWVWVIGFRRVEP